MEHQKQHLNSLTNIYTKENILSQAKAIQELIAHKSVRSTCEILRRKIKKHTKGQLDKIWIAVDENGKYVKDPPNRTVVEEGGKTYTQLLHRNTQQLMQAKDTQFATGKFAWDLKWDSTGEINRYGSSTN